MYIFGGRNEDETVLGDLWAFRIASHRWYTFQDIGTPPLPRYGHGMIVNGTDIMVVGGAGSQDWKNLTPEQVEDLCSVYILRTAMIEYPTEGPNTAALKRFQQLRVKFEDKNLCCDNGWSSDIEVHRLTTLSEVLEQVCAQWDLTQAHHGLRLNGQEVDLMATIGMLMPITEIELVCLDSNSRRVSM